MLTQFIPHGHCYLWKANLVGFHLVSDLLIAISYYSIPLSLLYFVRKNKELPQARLIVLFAAFIISCGTSHLIEILTLWYPYYWLAGLVKAVTALISIYTAFELYKLIPLAFKLPKLATFETIKKKLNQEILGRQETEQALQKTKSHLSSFYDAAPMMMGIIKLVGSHNFEHISYNSTAASFFGTTSEVVQDKAEQLKIVDEIHSRIIAACLISKDTNKPFGFEFTRRCSQSYQHYSAIVSTISNKSSVENTHYSYIIEDISDRKQLEIALQENEERFRQAFQYAAIGMTLVSLDGYFVRVNSALCEILGYSEGELAKIKFQDITHSDDFARDIECVRQLISGEAKNYHLEKRYIHKNGNVIWILLSVSIVRDKDNNPQYYIAQIQDITVSKTAVEKVNKSLREKEVMLKEIHHRVKNNLQVICSLLNLQSRYLKEEKMIKSFRETQNRVRSMAAVHEQLYQSDSLSEIVLLDYVQQLTGMLFKAYATNSNIKCNTEIEDFNLDLDTAVPCGLIINELVSNAFKYAFDSKQSGTILIKATANQENSLVLTVKDDGIGLKPDFDLNKTKSLGLRLVKNLTEQLQGTLQLDSDRNWGTQFEFVFDRIKK